MSRATSVTLSGFLDSLSAHARTTDVPVTIAEEARRATSRRFADCGRTIDSATQRRAEAYFSAVVRRRVTRRGVAPRAASRLVVATVVNDLTAAGRDPHAIWSELQTGWSGRVSSDVLEEYRLRLCG